MDALLAAEKEGLDSLNDPAVVNALVKEQLSKYAQADSANSKADSEVDSEVNNSDSNSNNNKNDKSKI